MVCTDAEGIDPEQPNASHDTLIMTGRGRWNGQSGATIVVTLIDDGEPVRNSDTIEFTVGLGTTHQETISISGGNHQAHG